MGCCACAGAWAIRRLAQGAAGGLHEWLQYHQVCHFSSLQLSNCYEWLCGCSSNTRKAAWFICTFIDCMQVFGQSCAPVRVVCLDEMSSA
jgi:hypothetical protein